MIISVNWLLPLYLKNRWSMDKRLAFALNDTSNMFDITPIDAINNTYSDVLLPFSLENSKSGQLPSPDTERDNNKKYKYSTLYMIIFQFKMIILD